jgi:hypothetical protein
MLFLRRAKSFVLAIWSLIRRGPVSLSTYSHRTEQCMVCPKLKLTLDNEFCKACDCPEWAVADLRLKRLMPNLKCPLNKW